MPVLRSVQLDSDELDALAALVREERERLDADPFPEELATRDQRQAFLGRLLVHLGEAR